MYRYIHICMCVYMYIHIYIHTYIYILFYIFICIYICMYIYTFIYICVYIYAHIHAHTHTCMHTCMCAHTCAYIGAYRHVAGVRSVAMLAQEAQGRRSLRSQVQNRRSLRSKVQGYAVMGTNWHDINVWMDPAISRVVGRALARPSASMIEHGVGYATVYELCRTRRWHGHAGQFAEPIRMLHDAAVDMG